MDNDRVGTFALGLIVAVLAFLFLRREMHHGATPNGLVSGGGGGDDGAGTGGGGGCGCGGGGNKSASVPTPIGGQSYNKGSAYAGSSVVSSTSKESLFPWLNGTGNSLF